MYIHMCIYKYICIPTHYYYYYYKLSRYFVKVSRFYMLILTLYCDTVFYLAWQQYASVIYIIYDTHIYCIYIYYLNVATFNAG